MTTSFDDQFTPAEALALILNRLQEFDPTLADEAQAAIDRGRDEISREGAGRKARLVRRTVPFTVDESLTRVINLLRAHFVEAPLITNAALLEIMATPVGEGESGQATSRAIPGEVLVEPVSPAFSAIRAERSEQVLQPLEVLPESTIDEIQRLVGNLASVVRTGDGDAR